MNDVVNQIAGTGLIALDVLLRDENAAIYTALGGSTGNVLAILAFLGWRSFPIAHIGHDPAGNSLLNEFKAMGSDTRFLVSQGHVQTPVIYQWPGDEEKTHRFSFACPLCGAKRRFSDYVLNQDLAHEITETVTDLKVFYFDRITPLALKLAKIYRARGAVIFFEPSESHGYTEQMRNALELTHILKYADDRISSLMDFDLSNVAVEIQTLGAKGLRYRAPSLATDWVYLPAIGVPYIVDTAGAGDWCSAGLLYELFSEDNFMSSALFTYNKLYSALRFGQALSALNCMYEGARGMMHSKSTNYLVRAAKALGKDKLVDSSSMPKCGQTRMRHYHKDSINPKPKANSFFQTANPCCGVLQFKSHI
jgi:fructokinase